MTQGSQDASDRRNARPRGRTGLVRRARVVVGAVAVLALAAVAGCSFGPPDEESAGSPPRFPTPSTSAAAPRDQQVAATVLAKGLDVPWGVAFLPDGGALVTERDSGRILKVGPQSDTSGLRVTEVQRLGDEVQPEGEGGLMGVAVSPEYDSDQTVFIYYTAAEDNRIARLKLGEAPQPIVTGIPRAGIHNGGRLAFGPDGFLYATTGDASQGETAQDPASLGGKILRMTMDGKPADGNPTKDSLVWSFGHRNVQGIAWDAGKRMYATEFGQTTWDEINVIQPGKNYGWPMIEGKAADAPTSSTPPDPQFVEPLVTWPTAESSCSGLAVLERLIAAACLAGKRLWLLETTAAGALFGQPRPALQDQFGRLRTVTPAPDGSLWVTTSNRDGRGEPTSDDDRIIRLVFAGGGGGKS